MNFIKLTKRIMSVLLLSLLTFLLFFSSNIIVDSVAKEQNTNSDSTDDISEVEKNILIPSIFDFSYTVDYKFIDNSEEDTTEEEIKYAPELTEEEREKIKELEAQNEPEVEELDYTVIDVDPYDQYVTIDLNIRSYPSSEDEETIIDVATFASIVTVIGKVEDSNWVKIKYESDEDDKKDIEYAFVYGGYFSDTKPEPKPVVTYTEPTPQATEPETTPADTYVPQSGCLTPSAGVFDGPSGKETYYNLNMSGVISIMRGMGYTEEEYPYWVREDGCKMFGPYIMVAANLSIRPKGTILPCSLGTAIVVDTGGFAASNPTQLDIATSW